MSRSATGSVTLPLPTSCTSSDVLAHVADPDTQLAFRVTAQDLTASTIDLTAVSWLSPSSCSVDITNIPSRLVQISTQLRAGEQIIHSKTTVFNRPSSIGDVSVSANTFAISGAEAVTRVDFQPTQQDNVQTFVRRGPASPSAPIDAAQRVVDLQDAAYTGATRQLTWQQGSVGDPVDAVRGTLVFDRAGSPDLTWEILHPGASASSQGTSIPALPSELAAVDPGTTSSLTPSIRGYAVPGGYTRVRARVFAHPPKPGCCSEVDQLLTEPGTLRVVGGTP